MQRYSFFLNLQNFLSFFLKKMQNICQNVPKRWLFKQKRAFLRKIGHNIRQETIPASTNCNKQNQPIHRCFFQKREEFYQKNIKNNIISSRTPSVTHCLSHLLYFQNSHYFHQKTIYFTAIYLFYIKKDSKSCFLHTKSMFFLCF